MPVAVDKLILIGVLVVFIGLCVSYGVSICSQSKCKEDDSDSDSENEKEGFTNPVSESTAPTRASDCRCLPGYIPSNKNSVNGKIIKIKWGNNIGIILKLNNSNEYYFISWFPESTIQKFNKSDMYCGLDFLSLPTDSYSYDQFIQKMNEEKLNIQIFDKNRGSCSILQTKTEATYFCQSLSDPTQTRSCY